MSPDLDYIQYRLALALQEAGSDVTVRWIDTAGGTLDVTTGAVVGGVQTPASGVLRALGVEELARSVVRQYAEIQAGDLLLEIDAAALITKDDGSTVCLDDLDGPSFLWGGQWYQQKEVGEGLAAAWNAVVGNQRLYRTLLLRRGS
ncbi:MAG TPA: hypothetical protein VMU04_10185 [Candidatus Acidoferrum sp.]|nr:hypothetical protein [Candidatus Acidoferrum sp.]